MIKRLQITFLIIVPLIFLLIGLRFDRTKYGTDPESAYLMNGLNIAMGKAVGHFDNPGTTVQMYSAVALRVTHALRSTDYDLQTDVLLNSEYYIEVLRKGLIVINALILMMLGLVTFSILGNIWAGLLLQVAPFLSVTLIEELFTKVAPEPLLFATVAVLIMLLLKFYISAEPNNKKYPLLFGLLGGFGLATKMTFLPVLLIPFILLNGRRNKLVYIITIIPAFVLFTLPAVKGYLHMANWFLNLGTHTGTYGQGNTGIIDPGLYFSSIISIAENNIALIAVMLLATAVILLVGIIVGKQKSGKSKSEFYMLVSVLVAQFASVFLVAKHYHSNHYLFPALSLTGFVLVLIYLLVNRHASNSRQLIMKTALPLTLAVVIGLSLLTIPYLSLAYKGYRMSNQSTDEAFDRIGREYKDFAKVYYYPVSFNEYSSLRWGNVYSRQYSTKKLMELFPDGLFFNVWEKSFQLWETNISTREFVRKYGSRILLVGGPRTDEELKTTVACGLKLKKLFESRVQVVYEIDTASQLFEGAFHNREVVWSSHNDFETLSSDGQWIMSENGAKFCKNLGPAVDKARSGKFAFSLPVMDSYGMEYVIQDVKPGETYEMSIWRAGSSKDAFLVASADSFYQQSDGFIEVDAKGWEKVFLGFKIPEGFKGNKLKIYLWNHSNNQVWFDDFQIAKY